MTFLPGLVNPPTSMNIASVLYDTGYDLASMGCH